MKSIYGLLVFCLMFNARCAWADARTKAAQEAAEYVLKRFGRTVVTEGTETLARKIETYAAKHGDDFFKAVRQCGPRAFHLVEEAGVHGTQVVRVLAQHGEAGAVWVASRPKGMQLLLTHGEEAASVLVRHPGVAEPVVESLGRPAINALQATGPQAGRRLGMLLESGELAKIGRSEELLEVIAKYGDRAMKFVWENKGALTATAALTVFLTNPEPFINGAKDLTEAVVKPVAEVPAILAKEAAAEVAKSVNWTLIFSLCVLATGSLIAIRLWLKRAVRRP